jgi:hypothetical protein
MALGTLCDLLVKRLLNQKDSLNSFSTILNGLWALPTLLFFTIWPSDKSKRFAIREFPSKPPDHGFTDIVDNYAGLAHKFPLRDNATLYQLEGSLGGVDGRFEWIIDPNLGGVTHRFFVKNGTINGIPIIP